MKTRNPFPKNLRFDPLQGLKAFVSGKGKAWILWVVLRGLDTNGLGRVNRKAARSTLLSLGVKPKTFGRWLPTARKFGFVKAVQKKTGEWSLALNSQKNICISLGLQRPSRYVSLPAHLLVGKGGKANLFAAWQSLYTQNGKRLVSQKRQSMITGVSEQSQRKYNKQAGVISKRNYAISSIPAKSYSGILEFGNRSGLFKYWDKAKKQKYLGWRLPNTRIFPLFGTSGSYNSLRALSLFNKTAEQYSKTMKALSKNTFRPKEVYIFQQVSGRSGSNLWTHFPVP